MAIIKSVNKLYGWGNLHDPDGSAVYTFSETPKSGDPVLYGEDYTDEDGNYFILLRATKVKEINEYGQVITEDIIGETNYFERNAYNVEDVTLK